MSKKQNLIGWGIMGIGLVVSVPLLIYYCMDGIYVNFYLERLQSVEVGELFLLPFSLLVQCGLPADVSYKGLLLLLNFATAFIAYTCFAGMFEDKLIGLFGSMLYTWAPYRVNALYVTGEVGEAISACFLPIVIYGFYLIFTVDTASKKYSGLWILPTVGLSCLMQSYLLTFLTVAGMTVLLCICLWKKTFRKGTLLVLLKTLLGVAILNAWMWVPLLRYLQAEKFLTVNTGGKMLQPGGLYLAHYLWTFFRNGNSFHFDENGMVATMPLGAGFALMLCVFVYLWLLFTGKGRKKESFAGRADWSRALAVTGGIMLVMSLNCFPWDSLRPMNKVFFWLIGCLQSPAKLVLPITICFTVSACMAAWFIRQNESEKIYHFFLTGVAVLCFVLTQFLTGDILSSRAPLTEGAESVAEQYLSVLDYGKYLMNRGGNAKAFLILEVVSVVLCMGLIALWMWRNKKRVEEI